MWEKIYLMKYSTSLLIGTVIFFSGTAVVHADPVTFAQFEEENPVGSSPNQFTYQNNGASSDSELLSAGGGIVGTSIPVEFSYESGVPNIPLDLQGPQAATLTLSASSLTPVTTAFGGTVASQPLTGAGHVVDSLTITRDTPAAEGSGSRTTLLQVTFTGNLMGFLGGTTPQLIGDTGLGDTVNYNSDFLALETTLTPRDFAVTFSSWFTTADGNGLEVNPDGYYSSATAAASGTFDANFAVASVPDPNPLIMGVVLMFGVYKLARRRFPD
jgi:hypothetical protein